ncbi:uncharacterized protein LOC118646825 [Monomorium pharaonis]|uniref:uncharacterized protein LOC118646825 n=1 Tax=Monomorium pharaonis TaxID=307658 RepID=UPI001746E9F2|nr:uncharacterized protein LOC118646825 [Monomorium pharaonis]
MDGQCPPQGKTPQPKYKQRRTLSTQKSETKQYFESTSRQKEHDGDVLVRRNGDGTLSHQVYRKPTYTDRYLYATSHHYPSQKNSVISSLVYRAFKISETTSLNGELEHLNQVLTKNEYNSRNISQTVQRLKNKKEKEKEREDNKMAFLPYLQGYIGKTGRKINTQIKGHQRCTKYGHFSQSALAENWMETGHSVQYEKVTMLALSQGYIARKHRESLEILKHPDNLNRNKGYQISPRHTVLPVF